MPADLPLLLDPARDGVLDALLFLRGDDVREEVDGLHALDPDVAVLELDDLFDRRGQQALQLQPLDLELLPGERGRPLLLGEPEVGFLAALRDLDVALLGPERRLGLLVRFSNVDRMMLPSWTGRAAAHDRVRACCRGTFCSLTVTLPLTSSLVTTFSPLNSARMRRMLLMSVSLKSSEMRRGRCCVPVA
jgi:hypothetical protein